MNFGLTLIGVNPARNAGEVIEDLKRLQKR